MCLEPIYKLKKMINIPDNFTFSINNKSIIVPKYLDHIGGYLDVHTKSYFWSRNCSQFFMYGIFGKHVETLNIWSEVLALVYCMYKLSPTHGTTTPINTADH